MRQGAEEIRARKERDFQSYGWPLNSVTLFKHIGRILMASDDDCMVVVGILRKAGNKWTQLLGILVREEDKPRVLGMFFNAMVLLFVLEM